MQMNMISWLVLRAEQQLVYSELPILSNGVPPQGLKIGILIKSKAICFPPNKR